MKKITLVLLFILSTTMHATKYYEIISLQKNNFKALASLMEASDTINQSIRLLNGRARAMDQSDLYSYDTEPSKEIIDEEIEKMFADIKGMYPQFPQKYFDDFKADLQQGITRADTQKTEAERPLSHRNKKNN